MKVVRSFNGFDVFTGEGWENHARIHLTRHYKTGEPFVKQVDGNTRLSTGALRLIAKSIKPQEHYQNIGL